MGFFDLVGMLTHGSSKLSWSLQHIIPEERTGFSLPLLVSIFDKNSDRPAWVKSYGVIVLCMCMREVERIPLIRRQQGQGRETVSRALGDVMWKSWGWWIKRWVSVKEGWTVQRPYLLPYCLFSPISCLPRLLKRSNRLISRIISLGHSMILRAGWKAFLSTIYIFSCTVCLELISLRVKKFCTNLL